MPHYRKIQVGINNDRKVRELSDDAKLVWVYSLLTHPLMTAVGAMRGTLPGLAAEVGWPEKRFRAAAREIMDGGMMKVDERASCVWLPKFMEHNKPENPNAVKSWASALAMLPECDLLDEAVLACARCLSMHVGYKNAAALQSFFTAIVESMRKQFGEQFDQQLTEGLAEGLGKPLPEWFTELIGERMTEQLMNLQGKGLPTQRTESREQRAESREHSFNTKSTGVEKASAEELAIVRSLLRELPLESTALVARQIIENCRKAAPMKITAICAELRKTCARCPRNAENPTGWVISQVGKAFTAEAVEAERMLQTAE